MKYNNVRSISGIAYNIDLLTLISEDLLISLNNYNITSD